jgi:hypothetical protein
MAGKPEKMKRAKIKRAVASEEELDQFVILGPPDISNGFTF